ncbi:MAG: hypothetical protein EPO25_02935 [Gammaproteobacteria bacterium]|nr:MAG: hypothetical protein EPO25_02935 [Gammaproteobacteria bacterium]
MIPAQVIGEYLRFIQRRAPQALDRAIDQISLYRATFLVPSTTEAIISSAAEVRGLTASSSGMP